MFNIGKNIKSACEKWGIKNYSSLTDRLMKEDAEKLANIYIKLKIIESNLVEVEEEINLIESNYHDFPSIADILSLCVKNIKKIIDNLNNTDRNILKDAHKIVKLRINNYIKYKKKK